MNPSSFQPDDFLLSGAIETTLVYLEHAFLGAVKGINQQPGLVLCQNGLCSVYFDKQAVTRAKNRWLKATVRQTKREYEAYRRLWQKHDRWLYNLASHGTKNWRRAWHQLNQWGADNWLTSGHVESLDWFGDEIESLVRKGMERANLNSTIFSDLIASSTMILTQRADRDLLRTRRGELSTKTFLRRYWFLTGTWNGGAVLTEIDLNTLEPHAILARVFEQRRRLHTATDKKLDRPTRELVQILRLLVLWREERKATTQKLAIAFATLTAQVSQKLHLEPHLVRWLQVSELNQTSTLKVELATRQKTCAFYATPAMAKVKLLTVADQRQVFDRFFQTHQTDQLTGTIASPGQAKGTVRIILREADFGQFQDGEILVTSMTRPEYVPLMKRAAAVITDEGGLTSHAAIVSRELGIPCIVGTKLATQVLKNGMTINVDAEEGTIKGVNRHPVLAA